MVLQVQTPLEPLNKPNAGAKRNAGSNKSRRKKREYKAHVHNMIAAGHVNDARGTWTSPSILDGKVRQRAESQAARFSR